MNRRQFLARAAAALAASAILPAAAKAQQAGPKKPNIIVILADDLGYGEIGCYGGKDVPTPNVDALAAGGVRFTDGYVSCPVCSPTRAGLMTGRYQQRFGHELNPGPAQSAPADFGLSLAETPLPARLKALGYATGMFGKWHLGYLPPYHPLKRGFDEFYGFLGGAHDYLDAKADPFNPVLEGEKPVEQVTYTTDEFARRATDFIGRHKDGPFFLYLPFNAVHAPLESIEKYLDRLKGVQDEKRRTFLAMLSAMDDGIGMVTAKVRELGIEENTLIFFFSDNGGPTPSTTSKNDPLRGTKAQVLEGGIRIPYIIQWKGQVPAGTTYSSPVIQLDIHPTALAAAGGAPASGDKPFDGVNLLPYLKGEQTGAPHDRLFWRYDAQWAVRAGDWKLLQQVADENQLYNLAQDIGEAKNLAAEQPEKVKELRTIYDGWNAQLVAPKWSGGGGRKAGKGAKKNGAAPGAKKAGKRKKGI